MNGILFHIKGFGDQRTVRSMGSVAHLQRRLSKGGVLHLPGRPVQESETVSLLRPLNGIVFHIKGFGDQRTVRGVGVGTDSYFRKRTTSFANSTVYAVVK